MAATVRMLLTLLLVAKASCGLLPVDLSGISPGALLHLGLDTPSGGLLGGLGEILSSGVGTVGSLGQGVLGKVTALTLQHESDPSDIINVEPWKQDLSYPAYWLDTHKNGLDQSKQVSYADWINNRHNAYYHQLSHHEGDLSTSSEYLLPKPHLNDQVPQIDKPANNVLDGSHVYLDKESSLDGDEPKIVPFSTERPDKSNEVDDAIHFPESEEIIKINSESDENVKSEPARDIIIVQNPNVGVTSPSPVNGNNPIIILQPGNQPSNNGIYVLPTTSNLVNQDFNRVPQVPTVYVDNQGRRYYIIQTNNNIVNEPVQPIKVTTPPTTQGNNQIYVIMNINGQQVLVPASRLPNNGLQMDINVKPNPATPGQMYVYVPSNNGENNVVTNAPVTNPVVNYVTTPKYISFEKEPVTEQNDTETSEVTESVSMEVPSDIENTKEESEGKDTDGIVESIGDDDIRK
ncbi:uncharacterized protein LOC115448931 isoform X1 [Manduca sexta]|uniref:uncharacterized protein LOC115448931 isoform X1 n=2 Tax=Manduca sexta TaxID=7130 RepID=UPI00189046CF|nr:uncharacterized protein LOC115448931 isoform X1 [Manduca sexta]